MIGREASKTELRESGKQGFVFKAFMLDYSAGHVHAPPSIAVIERRLIDQFSFFIPYPLVEYTFSGLGSSLFRLTLSWFLLLVCMWHESIGRPRPSSLPSLKKRHDQIQ